MTLRTGVRLGSYEIRGPVGAGGMGEVYRAWDERLGREVALKVLPESVATDPDRLRRFDQEARAAGALNHPNILAVYDVGTHESTPYIVSELLEGETLRGRLRAGGLTPRKAVEHAIQIARGLAAAHQRGIVHRDLKPENVFVTRDGQVKILDFGLAKLRDPAASDPEHETRTRETRPGVIMGTVPYMSPEQVRGLPADARSDIFALGSVLYEMLARRRAFVGETASEIETAILREEPPDLSTLDSHIPAALDRIVRRCLEKRAEDRFETAQDVAYALETVGTTAGSSATLDAGGRGRRWPATLRLVATLLVGLLAGALLLAVLRRPTPLTPAGPITIMPITTDGGGKNSPRLSPDGEKVAYAWAGPDDDNWDIYVKVLGPGTRPLRITEDPATDWSPTWSPDGRQIAFVRMSADKTAAIHTVPSLGGQERKLVDVSGLSWATDQPIYFIPILSWAPDGEWLAFGEKASRDTPARILRISLSTLEKQPLTSPPPQCLGDLEPQLSPDGRLLAFVRGHSRSYGNQDVWVQPVNGGEARRLTSGQYSRASALSWTADGSEVVFSDVVPFFLGGRIARVPRAGGAPQPVVGVGENAVQASVQGTRMVYVQETPTVMDAWRIPRPGASPPTESPSKLFGSSSNRAYSPDGRKIAFESNRGGSQNIWISQADGSHPVQLSSSKSYSGTPRWSPDGRRLAFDSLEAGNWDVYVIGVDGGMLRRLTQEPSDETTGTWSRDGRFIYFQSNRTGRAEVWKIPSDGGTAAQVTRDGGFYAVESEDGRELYYSKSAPSGIWRVVLSGGDESEVVKEPVDWQNWALGRRGIFYATVRPQVFYRREEFTIHYLAFGSAHATPLFREDGVAGHHWGLAVSRDEKWILFGKAPASQSELMLMENFR